MGAIRLREGNLRYRQLATRTQIALPLLVKVSVEKVLLRSRTCEMAMNFDLMLLLLLDDRSSLKSLRLATSKRK